MNECEPILEANETTTNTDARNCRPRQMRTPANVMLCCVALCCVMLC